MYIIPIVIYCLAVALFIVGLTFHDEVLQERRRKHNNNKAQGSLIVIDGGKHNLAKPARACRRRQHISPGLHNLARGILHSGVV